VLLQLIPSVSPQELSHYKQVRAKFATETMNSDDKMEKKQQEKDGLVKDLIEKTKANGIVTNGSGGTHDAEEDESENEEERKRKSAAKGKGKAREQ